MTHRAYRWVLNKENSIEQDKMESTVLHILIDQREMRQFVELKMVDAENEQWVWSDFIQQL